MIKLYQSIDHIKTRFGEGSLIRGRSLFPNRNIPEGFLNRK